MKVRICLIGLLMAVLASTTAWIAEKAGAADAQAAPRIVAPEPTYLFSPVVDGTTVEHDFVIENKGDAPLKISKVKAG